MPARRSRLVSAAAAGELAAALAALPAELDLPGAFSPDVLAEAQDAAASVPDDPAGAGVEDLRDIEFLTIDPEGSQDLDQALHLSRSATGAVLHYAIADVPAFVAPGGAIDAEARRRGQTIYTAGGRIPLHPPRISEDAASLLPDRDRRAFVWRLVLDDGARPTEVTVRRAVVRSRRQWSYAEAQRAIDDGTGPESLLALAWFGPLRAARERERGGASLNVPDVEIIADQDGYRLERRAPLPVEDWNAQVSLLTGMAAARIMLDGGIGILRTMPQAAAADVEVFRTRAAALGLPWPAEVGYGDYLRGLDRDDRAALAVADAAASLFRGAGYAAFDGTPPADATQAAIGAPYAHTTAPLRRLVDRWSLVICEALANGREVPEWARTSLDELPKIMGRTGQLAGRADAASVDRVEAALLRGREGTVFTGTVLGRRGDGARVQLNGPAVTVSVAGLGAEPGSTVRLRLQRVDIATGTIDFAALDAPGGTDGR
ncbi:RNB domain-containing ribonuclease [Microbacterium sp. P01]|uniref:RNB domain-containing ribonuclease n=1 Tax=Microbacterium sp. P01 TaxID=3366261 RepID=UPI00366C0D02